MKKISLGLIALLSVFLIVAQVQCRSSEPKQEEVKQIIFLIGDGMGLAQFHAAMQHSERPLQLERAQVVGLQKTYSATHKVTDSAASGTALATGTKTYNGAIGVGPDSVARVVSVLEKAAEKGLSTGLIATYRITHATPAAFIGHVNDRNKEEQIAADFLETDITFFAGGGRNQFEVRKDGRNLSSELTDKGYQLVYTLDELRSVNDGKVAGLLADSHLPKMREGRGDFLPVATGKALEVLSRNDKGFFIMIEGSMIDGGGHDNDIQMIVDETFDFDKAVGLAFDFADRNPGTLVVVTADHETGGLTPAEGSRDSLAYRFSTGGHTGVMVPVYAYGAGAERFSGIMENTDIPKRMMELLGL